MLTRNLLVASTVMTLLSTPTLAEGPGLGQPLGENEIPFYARHVMPDGTGLPQGSGTATLGEPLYVEKCGFCHGATGVEGPIQPLVGPNETYPTAAGQHWPYATTLFDYTRRAMPFNAPKSLTVDEVFALVAYVLYRNGLIGADDEINAENLADIAMPNKDNFVDLWARQGDKPY